jgi:ABC-2 type transport system ATP-binding protein
VAVLDGGRIVAQGTPTELKRRVPGGNIRLQLANSDWLDEAARAFPEAARDNESCTLTLPGAGDIPALRDVLDRLERSAITAEHLEVTTPDLDDVFLSLTGQSARKAM